MSARELVSDEEMNAESGKALSKAAQDIDDDAREVVLDSSFY